MPEITQFDLFGRSFKFEGQNHDGIDASFFVIYYEKPGMDPKLHSHPYAEIFITLDGEALFTIGEEEFLVRAGEIVIAPAHTPHKFVSTGAIPLRQVDIHCAPRMIQEELE